ncbi:MAG TPA: hypothetical protein VNL16_16065, partial [Chloroflexota bacterium]|nr:hypothetical protein [Chloroflexota bacterium]
DGFAALEPLNVGAVSTGPKPLHDHVAYASAGGAGGVYRLVSGTEQIKALTWAAWLSKPKGTRVADFSAALTPWIASGEVSLWRRQLVLGPAPEFCLTSAGGVELPPALPVLQTRRSQIWPAETR